MNQLLQYSGVMAILTGVIILALYHFNVMAGNGTLMAAAVIMVLGLIAHIILNKVRQEN